MRKYLRREELNDLRADLSLGIRPKIVLCWWWSFQILAIKGSGFIQNLLAYLFHLCYKSSRYQEIHSQTVQIKSSFQILNTYLQNESAFLKHSECLRCLQIQSLHRQSEEYEHTLKHRDYFMVIVGSIRKGHFWLAYSHLQIGAIWRR